MTQLRKQSNAEEIGISEFYARHKQTSFGPQINYAEFGYDVIFPAPPPTFDPITQYARALPAVLTQLGTYQQAWEIVALDAEMIAANQVRVVEQDNARIKAELAALDLLSIRSLREYVAAQTNAPKIIKDRETAAQTKRGGLK